MSKTFIINLLILALLTYGVFIILRCKKIETRSRRNINEVGDTSKDTCKK